MVKYEKIKGFNSKMSEPLNNYSVIVIMVLRVLCIPHVPIPSTHE